MGLNLSDYSYNSIILSSPFGWNWDFMDYVGSLSDTNDSHLRTEH